MSTTGVQIIYDENKFTAGVVDLSWPTTYVASDGSTKRLPNCSLPVNYGYKTNNLVVEFESGHEQRRQKGLIRRTFDINYQALTMEQAQTIESFFFSSRGSVRAFNWTDPTSNETYVVRFDGDNFAKEYFGHNDIGPIYKISLKFIQVI